jgi:hypothetical protein
MAVLLELPECSCRELPAGKHLRNNHLDLESEIVERYPRVRSIFIHHNIISGDQTPPTITHTPVTVVAAGQPITPEPLDRVSGVREIPVNSRREDLYCPEPPASLVTENGSGPQCILWVNWLSQKWGPLQDVSQEVPY